MPAMSVAAASARNVWAVGSIQGLRTLIVHWNGRTWDRQSSPSPGGSQGLSVEVIGVAAISARGAWAVGYASGYETLILHWDGRSWARVPSPRTARDGLLLSVAATSAGNAWAVGRDLDNKALILHWDGTAWKRIPCGTDNSRGSAAPAHAKRGQSATVSSLTIRSSH
jgi:hypothetical protein